MPKKDKNPKSTVDYPRPSKAFIETEKYAATPVSVKKHQQYLSVPVDPEVAAIRAERERLEKPKKVEVIKYNEEPPSKKARSAICTNKHEVHYAAYQQDIQDELERFELQEGHTVVEIESGLSEDSSCLSDDYVSPDENSFVETKYYLNLDSLFPNMENKLALHEDAETRITNRLIYDYVSVPEGKKYREWLPQMVDKDDINCILEDIPGGITDEEFFETGIKWLNETQRIVIRPAPYMKKKFGTVKLLFKNIYIMSADNDSDRMLYIGERYSKWWYTFLTGAHPIDIHVFDFDCRVNMFIEKEMNLRLCFWGGDRCNNPPYHQICVYAFGDQLQATITQIVGDDKTTPIWSVTDKKDSKRLVIKGPKGLLKNYNQLIWKDIENMAFTVYLPDEKTEAGSIIRKPHDATQMLDPSWALVITCAQNMPVDLKSGLIAAAMLFSKHYMEVRYNISDNVRCTGFLASMYLLTIFVIVLIFVLLKVFLPCAVNLDCLYAHTSRFIKPP